MCAAEVFKKNKNNNKQTKSTDKSGQHFKAEHWIVLEELDKRKGYQREIFHLSKDGCPVS